MGNPADAIVVHYWRMPRMVKTIRKYLTNCAPIKVEAMAPILPIVEQVPNATCRTSVGNSSAVYTYATLKAADTNILPIKAKAVTPSSISGSVLKN